MTKQKMPICSLLFMAAILLSIFVSVSYAETAAQMAQAVEQSNVTNTQAEKDAIVKANENIVSGTIKDTDVLAVTQIYGAHQQLKDGLDFIDRVLYMKRGAMSYVLNRNYPHTREFTLMMGISFARSAKDADRLFKYGEDYVKNYPNGFHLTEARSAMDSAAKMKKDTELDALTAADTEKDPIIRANKKLASGTIQWKDIDALSASYHSGHEQYVKAMDILDNVIYLKRGSPGYISNKNYSELRPLTLFNVMMYAAWDKDADRLFKYASDYLQDYPKGDNVINAQRNMETALKLKKDKELQEQAATNKRATPRCKAQKGTPEDNLKEAVLDLYNNERVVAEEENPMPSDMVGNVGDTNVTIKWEDDGKTSANVVYDSRAGVMIGRIGHYRELFMKKNNGCWQLEKVLKDIRSGMGDVR